jgi:hypothetical protein
MRRYQRSLRFSALRPRRANMPRPNGVRRPSFTSCIAATAGSTCSVPLAIPSRRVLIPPRRSPSFELNPSGVSAATAIADPPPPPPPPPLPPCPCPCRHPGSDRARRAGPAARPPGPLRCGARRGPGLGGLRRSPPAASPRGHPAAGCWSRELTARGPQRSGPLSRRAPASVAARSAPGRRRGGGAGAARRARRLRELAALRAQDAGDAAHVGCGCRATASARSAGTRSTSCWPEISSPTRKPCLSCLSMVRAAGRCRIA